MSDTAPAGIVRNRFGYHELQEKPAADELKRYYQQKYFQEGRGHYSKTYTEEEVLFLRSKLEQKHLVISRLLAAGESAPRLLDIGAGEGWALDYFRRRGWRCTGLDFSDAGCRTHNPACLDALMIGDLQESIATLRGQGATFDVLWLDNVLEHLLDPLGTLRELALLAAEKGVLVVEVPNDFSALQETLLSEGRVSRPYWVALPDHISYFNREGLLAVCAEAGWRSEFTMADFPVDFNLFNPATNYVEDASKGRGCHLARIAVENLCHRISPERTVELLRCLADLGLGRQIIGFFRKGAAERPQ